jgi:phosphoglycolate phosphatase
LLRVLFWDIDGTLLTTARSGIFAWEDAVREILDVTCDLASLHTAGMTDMEISRLLVTTYRPDAAAELSDRIARTYETRLPACLPRRVGRVLPGVRDVLEHLRGRADVLNLLLTGNTRLGARAKLEHYELAEYFVGGGFGDDGWDRAAVAHHALAVARERVGADFPPERAFVIGDTPSDVRCGKVIGARTVAVATGAYSVEELRACEPWAVVPELPDPEAFLRLLDSAEVRTVPTPE